MFIIDFSRKGNVVRFFLGNNPDYYGDDWNDMPYEYNAGKVYDEFILGYKDVAFDFDTIVMEPADGVINSEWSKESMKQQKVPCICVLHKKDIDNENVFYSCFEDVVSNKHSIKYYFGDKVNEA